MPMSPKIKTPPPPPSGGGKGPTVAFCHCEYSGGSGQGRPVLPLGFYVVISHKGGYSLCKIMGNTSVFGKSQWKLGPCSLNNSFPAQWGSHKVKFAMQSRGGNSYQIDIAVGNQSDTVTAPLENWHKLHQPPRTAKIEGIAQPMALTPELRKFCQYVIPNTTTRSP
jgi:hypothetical protein